MLPDDLFCRAAVYPQMLKKEVFDDDTLLMFSGLAGGGRAISFASYTICEDDEGVHSYGLHVASSKNARLQSTMGSELSLTETQYYLGFYSFNARFLRCIKLSFCVGRLYHSPEEGQDCHFQYDVKPINDAITQKEIKRDERIARSRIADALFGPVLLSGERCSEHIALLQQEFMPPRFRAIGDDCGQMARA